MKETLLLIAIGLLIALGVWAIYHDHKAYQRIEKMATECNKRGGVLIDTQIGFITHRYQCAK